MLSAVQAAQGTPLNSDLSAQYTSTTIAADDFNRTGAGFGGAQIGGTWSSSGQDSDVNTNGAYGLVEVLPAASGTEATLSAAQSLDTDVQATFSLPNAVPDSAFGAYPGVQARVQSDGSAYQVYDYVQPGGRVSLTIQRVNAGNRQTFLANMLAPFNLDSGQTAHIEEAVIQSDSGPIIAARTWLVGTTVPDWQVTTTDADTAGRVSSAGSTGLINYAESGNASTLTSRFQSFGAYDLTAKVSTPIAAPPAAPTSAPVPSTASAPTTAPTVPSTTTAPSTSAPAPSTSSAAANPVAGPPVTVSANGAGSAAVGSTAYAVPADAVFVSPSGSDASGTGSINAPYATIQHALSAVPTNGTIELRGGTYHQGGVFISNVGITIQAYPHEAVWFDGSTPVSQWTQQGNTWVHSGWTAQFDDSVGFSQGDNDGTYLDPAYPLAAHPDQVFRDGTLLQLVSGTPGPGQFAVANNQLIVGEDPTGHQLQASDLQTAFVIAGQVTMRGFGVERYATSMPQLGAIYEGGSTGNSTFQNLVVDDNAMIGINLSKSGNLIDHVTTNNNGMSGVEIGTGGPLLTNETVQYSQMSGNNTHHFNAAPSAGGIKVGTVNGLLIKGNNVTGNHRISGIWTDQNVTNFTIVNNVVSADGTRGVDSTAGIGNELSDTGIVANNVVSGFQEGITEMDTGDVKIVNNTVYNNSTWDIGLTQDDRYKPGLSYEPAAIQPSSSNPWLIRNETVQNNVFADSTGGMFQFYVLDKLTNRPASSMNLNVQGNLFTHKDVNSQPTMVGWGGSDNTTVTYYQTPADFAAGTGTGWANAQTPTDTAIGAIGPFISSQASVAVAMPDDVAAAVGVPSGTHHLGAF